MALKDLTTTGRICLEPDVYSALLECFEMMRPVNQIDGECLICKGPNHGIGCPVRRAERALYSENSDGV